MPVLVKGIAVFHGGWKRNLHSPKTRTELELPCGDIIFAYFVFSISYLGHILGCELLIFCCFYWVSRKLEILRRTPYSVQNPSQIHAKNMSLDREKEQSGRRDRQAKENWMKMEPISHDARQLLFTGKGELCATRKGRGEEEEQENEKKLTKGNRKNCMS